MAKVLVTMIEGDKTGVATIQRLIQACTFSNHVCTVLDSNVCEDHVEFKIELTCQQLVNCFDRAGYFGQEVMAMNNEDQTFLAHGDDNNILQSKFSLELRDDLQLCAHMSGTPENEWEMS